MRIVIIRHGDPDYEHDTLTEKGWREAKLLAKRVSKLDVKDFYVSSLGRARDTAKPTLEAMNRTAEVCEWLQEFPPRIMRPDVTEHESIAWDWLPQDWKKEPKFFDRKEWMNNPNMLEGHVGDVYNDVIEHFDQILKDNGYERQGDIYKVNRPNRDTIVFFCHYGSACVLLSHLMDVSPMILWHHITLPTSSVTTVYSEERRPGIATFRACGMGDTSHLYAASEPVSFSARFCETFDSDERHD